MMKVILRKIAFATILMLCFSAVAYAEDAWRPFDKNGNDELSFDEFMQLRIAQYAALDRNGDGKWTRREFVKRMPDMSMGRIDSLRGQFKRWDKDENGLWDTSEAAKAIEGNFKWLDKNKNGSLAIKEFPKVF
ncbi:MAG: hypothetical protein CBD18_02960 [Opitutales bacterium TMED158]|nr:MAG: hypothetical protein CBD18_02960 [Opitutales bacterium TMED158]